MKREKNVITISLGVPILLIVVIVIATVRIAGKKLITNSVKYIEMNALTTADGNFKYEELEDGTIEIIEYKGNDLNVIIPETILGKNVTCIGDGAFGNCETMTTIKIPATVKVIGASAFYGCLNLKYIEIPEGLECIESWAFEDCLKLKNIEIPASVIAIGEDAFYGCIELNSINVNENNAEFMSENGILFNKEKTEIIKYPPAKDGKTYTIPKGVTAIGYSAFELSQNLYTVEIPETVTSIGDYAFDWCRCLKNLEIPSSVTEIGYEAFACNTNLSKLEILGNAITMADNILEDSIITKTINIGNATNSEIELPSIITLAIEEDINSAFELVNCELSEDATKLIVNIEKLETERVYLYISSGILDGLTIEVVPSGTITYCASNVSNWYPIKENVVAILHLAEGENITNNNGENSYRFNKNGEFTFEYIDNQGNSKTSTATVDWLWEVNVMGEYITEIEPKKLVGDLKANILKESPEGYSVKILSKNDMEVEDSEYVATGMKIQGINSEEIIQQEVYIAIVKGDIDGDGDAGFRDITNINSYRLNKKTLDDECILAADVNDDGIVDFKDIVKINKYRLHKIIEL